MGTFKKEKLNLNPDEMAFRAIYHDLLMKEKIKVVFRPGKRICGDFRGYCPGQKVAAKIIKKIGSDQAGVPPEFYNDFFKTIIIKKVEAKKRRELTQEDFIDSSPDVKDKKSLKYHLGLIYNLLPSQLKDESIVTIIKFKYKGGIND